MKFLSKYILLITFFIMMLQSNVFSNSAADVTIKMDVKSINIKDEANVAITVNNKTNDKMALNIENLSYDNVSLKGISKKIEISPLDKKIIICKLKFKTEGIHTPIIKLTITYGKTVYYDVKTLDEIRVDQKESIWSELLKLFIVPAIIGIITTVLAGYFIWIRDQRSKYKVDFQIAICSLIIELEDQKSKISKIGNQISTTAWEHIYSSDFIVAFLKKDKDLFFYAKEYYDLIKQYNSIEIDSQDRRSLNSSIKEKNTKVLDELNKHQNKPKVNKPKDNKPRLFKIPFINREV